MMEIIFNMSNRMGHRFSVPQKDLKLCFYYHIDNMPENNFDFIVAYHQKHLWRCRMSKWISGQQLLNEFGIEAFELFYDYVQKGLQPYNDLGNPISASYVVAKITKLPGLKEQYHEKRYSEAEIGNDELKKFDATIGHELLAQIEHYENWTRSIRDLDWNKFKLPETEAEARVVLTELVNSLYHIDDIKKFLGVPEIDIDKKEIIPELPKAKKLTTDQKSKLGVQRVAKELYDNHPEFHPEIDSYVKMFQRKDIKDACERGYELGTVQKWISEIAPEWAKEPGIRPKKK